MAIKIYDNASLVPSGMWQAICDLCQRPTWHYRPGKEIAHCTEHSNWQRGMRKRIVPDIVQSGGLNKTKPESPKDFELRRLNRMDRALFRTAEKVSAQRVISGYDWASGLFDDVDLTPKDPDKVFCNICNRPTSYVQATKETKPKVRKRVEIYKSADGEVVRKESVHVIAETVYACPDCCLEIRKPIPVRIV